MLAEPQGHTPTPFLGPLEGGGGVTCRAACVMATWNQDLWRWRRIPCKRCFSEMPEYQNGCLRRKKYAKIPREFLSSNKVFRLFFQLMARSEFLNFSSRFRSFHRTKLGDLDSAGCAGELRRSLERPSL